MTDKAEDKSTVATLDELMNGPVSILQHKAIGEIRENIEKLKDQKAAVELLQKEKDIIESFNAAIASVSTISNFEGLDLVNRQKSIEDQQKVRNDVIQSVIDTIRTKTTENMEESAYYYSELPKLLDKIYSRVEGYPKSSQDYPQTLKADIEKMVADSSINHTKGLDNFKFITDILFGPGKSNKQVIAVGFDKENFLTAVAAAKVQVTESNANKDTITEAYSEKGLEAVRVQKELNQVSADLHKLEQKNKVVSSLPETLPSARDLDAEIKNIEALETKARACFEVLREIEKLKLPEDLCGKDEIMEEYLIRRKSEILQIIEEPGADSLKAFDKVLENMQEMKKSLAGNKEINAALKAAQALIGKKAFYTTKVQDKYDMIIKSITGLDLEDRGKVLTGTNSPVRKALGAKRGFFSIKETPVGKEAKSYKKAIEELGKDEMDEQHSNDPNRKISK